MTTNRRKTDPDDSQAHAHRRKTDSDSVAFLHHRVADCEESINKLLEANKQISETLGQLTANLGRVAEVLEAWNNAKGFWLTIKFFSAIAKAILPILAGIAALWAFVKTGQWLAR